MLRLGKCLRLLGWLLQRCCGTLWLLRREKVLLVLCLVLKLLLLGLLLGLCLHLLLLLLGHHKSGISLHLTVVLVYGCLVFSWVLLLVRGRVGKAWLHRCSTIDDKRALLVLCLLLGRHTFTGASDASRWLLDKLVLPVRLIRELLEVLVLRGEPLLLSKLLPITTLEPGSLQVAAYPAHLLTPLRKALRRRELSDLAFSPLVNVRRSLVLLRGVVLGVLRVSDSYTCVISGTNNTY